MNLRLRSRRKRKPASGAPESPYLAARTRFESLFRDVAKEKHAWMVAALAELVILIVVVAAYVQLASSARVVPYVVEVDRVGRAVAVGPAEPLGPTDERVIVRDLTLFIRNVRSVSTDGAAQLRMIQDAYAYVDRAAGGFLNDYFADPGNDPRLLAQRLTREVEVTGVVPIPNSETWKLQWIERERSRSGGATTTTTWEAYVTVKFAPPDDPEHIQANPLGLYVSGINWTTIQAPENTEGGMP
jgi:type IV secretion system protein VirB5